MGMGNLQRMAQQMQQEMERIQAELAEAEVEGSAGGGVVRAVVTGKQSLVSVTIDPSAVDADDVEMLQDLVTAAVNEALDASRRLAEQKMGAMQSLGGLGGLARPLTGHTRARTVATLLIEPVEKLIEAFNRLPGIGPKTAQRLTYPHPPRARRRGPGARRPRWSPRATRSCSASAASTSATRRSARSAAIPAATSRGCASSRSRSTSSPSSGPASSAACTTCSTARSRRSTGSGRTG